MHWASPPRRPCYKGRLSAYPVNALQIVRRFRSRLVARALSVLMLMAPLGLTLGACSTLSKLSPWSGNEAALNPPPDPSAVPAEELYNRGADAMSQKRYSVAATQFDLVEQTYPYSSWAVSAQLMQGYAQYLQGQYTLSIATLDRFIQLHPAHRDIAYAYYLRALCFYEQIADVRRDQKDTRQAMDALQEVVNRFPDSAYARDARLKIDLGRDHLAGKEMAIGRWYQDQHLYAAAIGRFQTVVNDYQTTNHVAEALHRLTEIYLVLGLPDQARKTAAVLGYNYPGSPWYSDSYRALVADDQVKNPADVAPPEAQPGFFTRVWHSVF
jgi:outer membrane protein assembly factor BamD